MSRSRVPRVACAIAAPPERTFAAFTEEIGEWWRPNGLFRFTDRDGTAASPSNPTRPNTSSRSARDGERFEIGPVLEWEPPHRLVFGWRQAELPRRPLDRGARCASTRSTTGTRVTVEHFGWDSIPQEHARAPRLPPRRLPAAHRRVVAGAARARCARRRCT